ncbi:hypothetical protein EV175_007506, partial [Coemansia sp. RSA 1933]
CSRLWRPSTRTMRVSRRSATRQARWTTTCKPRCVQGSEMRSRELHSHNYIARKSSSKQAPPHTFCATCLRRGTLKAAHTLTSMMS